VTTTRFGRDDRLTKPSEFERVFNNPIKDSSRYFTVLARVNDSDHARLGLAIAKKNIHQAVQRNRIKRLVRESFRHSSDKLGHVDIVVMARRGADQADRATLRDTLNQHWIQLALKCAD
jgi:ribonuclease P protein component